MKVLFFFFVFILKVISSVGQSKGLEGRLVETDCKTGLSGLTIQLIMHASQSDTAQTISGEAGLFHFDQLPTDRFSLIVRKKETILAEYAFNKPAAGLGYLHLGSIQTETKIQHLSEIVIRSPTVLLKEDTIEFRAAAFSQQINATTENLLKKIPGIHVDRDGVISFQGKQITRIKVNGKDFFEGNPKMVSKELPAAMIEKIQIVDDYGDQAALSRTRSGEPDKIINLQLKKEKNHGVFGKGQVGIGNQNRYVAGLSINRFNGGKQLSLILNSNNTNDLLLNRGEGGSTMGAPDGRTSLSATTGAGISTSEGNLTGGAHLQSGEGVSGSNVLGLHFRNDFGKRNSFYGSYTVNQLNHRVSQFSNMKYLLNQPLWGNSLIHTTERSLRHQASVHMEWHLDSMNYLKISPSFSFVKSGSLMNNRSNLYQFNPSSILSGLNFDSAQSSRLSMGTNVLFQHLFTKPGRTITINFDWAGTPGQQHQERRSVQDQLDEKGALLSQNIQMQKIKQSSRQNTTTFQTTYTEPLSHLHFLDVTYSRFHNRTVNDLQTHFKVPETGDLVFSDSLSQFYNVEYKIQKIGIAFRKQSKKQIFSMGFQYQPAVLRGAEGHQRKQLASFQNNLWFPQARLSYFFSRSRTLTVSYNAQAHQPSLTQLQPVRNTSNQQFQTEGNPFLRPSVSHTLNAGYNQLELSTGSVFMFNASLSSIKHQIVNHLIFLRNPDGSLSGSQLSRPENVQGTYNTNLMYSYSRSFLNRKCAISFSGSLQYNHNKTLVDDKELSSRHWLLNQGVVLNFNLPWLEASAGVRYSGSWLHFQSQESKLQRQGSWMFNHSVRIQTGNQWSVNSELDYSLNRGLLTGMNQTIALWNLSVEKEFLPAKNATVKITGFDLLNQNKSVVRSVSSIVVTDTRTNRLGRYFMLSFVYRLNQFKQKDR